ncbi:flagellin FlaB [Halovenus aranensis]|uniref:Flagellin n=1 Tax=Halovenus aranensis TaxID=890420 RepID=A0A1G8RMS6_9EURY|nr:archaellin/type IV pilin N-terminal domain-containing protein [Halovenus aranensis]SDJ18297.1 flagellin FlaB [Halovenus aranensis]
MKLSNNHDNENTTRSRAQVGIGTLIVFIAMVLVAAIAAGVLINTAGFLQTQAEDTGTESTAQVADNLNVITQVGQVGFDGVLTDESAANAPENPGDADKIEELRIGVQPAAGSNDVNLAELTMQYVSDNEFANIVAGHNINDIEDIDSDHFAYDSDGLVTDWNQSQFEDRENDTRAGGDTDPTNIVSVPGEANYVIEPVKAEDDTDVIMTDNTDRYEIVIPLDDTQTAFNSTEALDPNAGDDGIKKINYSTANSNIFDNSSDIPDDETIQPGLDLLKEGNNVELKITTEVGAQTVAFLQVPDSLSADADKDTVNL